MNKWEMILRECVKNEMISIECVCVSLQIASKNIFFFSMDILQYSFETKFRMVDRQYPLLHTMHYSIWLIYFHLVVLFTRRFTSIVGSIRFFLNGKSTSSNLKFPFNF